MPIVTRLRRSRLTALTALALTGTLALSLAACAESERGQDQGDPGTGRAGGTLTFGAAGVAAAAFRSRGHEGRMARSQAPAPSARRRGSRRPQQ